MELSLRLSTIWVMRKKERINVEEVKTILHDLKSLDATYAKMDKGDFHRIRWVKTWAIADGLMRYLKLYGEP
jgi:hypothetical protein